MAIQTDKSPVFMNIKAHMAWDKKTHVVDARKKINMNRYFNNGMYLDYIVRDEAALDFMPSQDQMADLLLLKEECSKRWNEYLDEHPEDINNTLIQDKFNQPLQDKITELRATCKSFSGLYMTEKNDNGDLEPVALSEEELQTKGYDSFSKINDKEQIVWTGVESFSDDFMAKNMPITPDLVNPLIVKNLKRMLKKSGWRDDEINRAKIGWAYHINTDNFHFHYYIYQQSKTRTSENAKEVEYVDCKTGKTKKYKKSDKFIERYAMDKKSLSDFRAQMESDISDDFTKWIESRDDFREAFKKWNENTLWSMTKGMYNGINNDWKLSSLEAKKVLLRLKQFQLEHYDEIHKYKYLGGKDTPQKFRDEMNKLSEEVINSIPKMKLSFEKFEQLSKDKAEAKFQKYVLYYKTPEDLDSDIELTDLDKRIQDIDPHDPKLKLEPQDYVDYHQRQLEKLKLSEENKLNKTNKEYEYKDAYTFLKDKKIEFEEEEIYSFKDNNNATPQGVMHELSNKLFTIMHRAIKLPEKAGSGGKKASPKKSGKAPSPHSYKNLTNKRMSNADYQLKKALNTIDRQMKKLELEAEKKFKQINAELEKIKEEELKQWEH